MHVLSMCLTLAPLLDKFPATDMDAVLAWERLVALIAPYYPKGGSGRRILPSRRAFRHHAGLQSPVRGGLNMRTQARCSEQSGYREVDGLFNAPPWQTLLSDRLQTGRRW